MKKTVALFLCVLASMAFGAEIVIKCDFEIENPDELFSAAREKFMIYPEKSVVENYESFFEAFEKSEDKNISAYRGKYGDCVAFIIPNGNVRDVYDYAVFKYPNLALLAIGGILIVPGEWDRFYAEIDEYMDPDFAP
jgi:hypothetical protein